MQLPHKLRSYFSSHPKSSYEVKLSLAERNQCDKIGPITGMCMIYVLGFVLLVCFTFFVVILRKADREKIYLRAEKEFLEKRFQELEEKKSLLKLEFENLSNRIFQENSARLQKDSEKNLVNLLAPFKEKIDHFQKRVEETYSNEARERFALKGVIEGMVTSADKLSSALRGDIKAQGAWGEVVLRRVLEASGLQEGREYFFQKSMKEEDNLCRPDVIINLPEERQVIVDSKVSLKHYDLFLNAETREDKESILKDFIGSLEAHVDELGKRNYQFAKETESPNLVLMFVPIESIFSLVIEAKKELFERAWKKSIVICSPANLLAILRTIESLWKVELHSRNAQKIAYEGARLYDKFVGFLEDLEEIGRNLDLAKKSHSEAFNKLKDGRGSIISHIEHLKLLGLQTKKEIGKELLEEVNGEK